MAACQEIKTTGDVERELTGFAISSGSSTRASHPMIVASLKFKAG